MAARTPFEPLLASAAGDQPITPESLGWQLLSALPELPLHTLSLHDDRGEVLWINEGSLGPHEQALVEDALQMLGADPTQPGVESGLDDGRAACVIPVRTPRGEQLLGLCLVVTDPTGDALLEALLGAQLRTIMRKLAVIMRPSLPGYAEPAGRAPESREPAPSRRAPPARTPALLPDDYEQDYPQEYSQDDYQANGYDGGGYAQQAEEELFEPPVAAPPPPPRRAAAPPARPAARVPPPPVPRQPPAPPAAARVPSAQKAVPQPARPPARPPRPLSEDTMVPPAAPSPAARTPSSPYGGPPPQSRGAPAGRSPAPTPGRAPAQGYAAPPPTLPAASTAPRAAPSPRPSMPAGGPVLGAATVAPSFPSFPSSGPAAPTRATRATQTDSGLALELLPFVKLRAGVKGRRFEIVPRPGRGESRSSLEPLVVQQLIGWLGANRGEWSHEPTSFTINLSITSLEDERFLRDTAGALRAQGIHAETLGFEIAESLYTQNRALVERFIASCEKTGCFLAIDDFTFDSAVLPLLRSRAVRLVKLDARLTGSLQRDKLSEALVTASIHATRVLGVHCAAKTVDSQQLLQWLRTAGCDVAQGSVLAGPQRLESIGTLG
jgi:EAL domain-containing protein (putative c-di-GMP-specific phosphodiesterase class I)